MSFTLNTRKSGDVVIIDMNGRLTIGEAVLLLRTTNRRFLEDGTSKFILNLGNVSHIDSAGLGELISIYTSVRNRQGDVKLLNLDKKAKDLLQMTKLLTVFDVYSDEQKALDNLNKKPE
jgi:anti-sigma B factor antagonist